MEDVFNRTEMLIGKEAVKTLFEKTVAVFGLGGVGSYTAAALARAGVGKLILVDFDEIKPSNINRQLFALLSTVGRKKTDVAREYIADISKDCTVKCFDLRYAAETADEIDLSSVDYIADCIDTVTSKLLLIERANEKGIPIISSMGTGNKLYPERFKISDISKTSVCPLARVMRRELKARGISHLKVLWSDEIPKKPLSENGEAERSPASISFVPPAAGLIIAGEIVRDLAGIE